VAAVDHPGARNRTIPIGGPQPLSLRDAAAAFECYFGKPVTIQSFTPDQPPSGWSSLAAQLVVLGSNTNFALDTAEVAGEFGIRLTSLDEFLNAVLTSAPATMG
jgi:uncharacterized protein YbjT (DUF2867 family)